MADITFTEGIKAIKKINDTFFYMKINSKEFYEWMEKHKKENGCVYINLCVSQNGHWYSKLSTYKGSELNQMESDYQIKKNTEKKTVTSESEKLPF